MRRMRLFLCCSVMLFAGSTLVYGAKLISVGALDKDYLIVHFIDGDVEFIEDGKNDHAMHNNKLVTHGQPLDTSAAAQVRNWTIASTNDPAYKTGKQPQRVSRKSKVHALYQGAWDNSVRDFKYQAPLGHTLYLKLPTPLQPGKRYEVRISSALRSDKSSQSFTYELESTRSEAIHVNLVGYMADHIKGVDLYQWLGDGGQRDYSSFAGNKVYVYDVKNKTKQQVGNVKFWKRWDAKDLHKYRMTGADVWKADITSFTKPGTYRVVIDGVGCSQTFRINDSIYREPFRVSIKGFYYMRIGEPIRASIKPAPRQPRYIPGKSPANCRVLITTMHPYHPQWRSFVGGDKWDKPKAWDKFVKPGRPENPNAWGGHSDALDWDRHLGHVSIIYDMVLPYILTNGLISDDNVGIPESGNGVPDILDEARNEVDFWLRLRDGEGYSHGLTNPNRKTNVLYQAANTTIAAWANAVNAAMLADGYRIAKKESLARKYTKHAEAAFGYAATQPDQQLNRRLSLGDEGALTGAELRMTAAAYLYNLTGKTEYGQLAVKGLSALPAELKRGLVWAFTAYLLSSQQGVQADLQARLRSRAIAQAKARETNLAFTRPSRRATDEKESYFRTIQNVHWSLLAHRICQDPNDRMRFMDALVLEAGWGLGRNPLNMIEMTTASTLLADRRSVVNCYTSGGNDGTPGMHPGHTPYINTYDWGKGMIMSRPRWMAAKGYPAFSRWPEAECYYDTRWVFAHSEFTPQQTMRGKMALYGYLHGWGRRLQGKK